jgi:hypothetical protein
MLIKSIDQLSKTLNNTISYVDIDYEVCDNPKDPWRVSTRSTVMKNERAIANAYRMWLQSKPNDYIRNPGFGGFFNKELNDRYSFSPSSEETIATALREESAAKWPDIEIIAIKVTCAYEKRAWQVKLTIRDKNTGMVALDSAASLILEETVNVDALE